jgi:hypothetical protein
LAQPGYTASRQVDRDLDLRPAVRDHLASLELIEHEQAKQGKVLESAARVTLEEIPEHDA